MKKLSLHISDVVEHIDLKIFEENIFDKTTFTFEINDSRDNSKIILRLEEKIAALLFEGLNHIFVEVDDTTDNIKNEDVSKIFENFFETLRKKDNEHFGLSDE